MYRIEIGGQNVTTLPAPATDKWGTFSATVQVPQLSPGRYAVKAIIEDAGGDSATEFLQVVETVEVVSTDPAEVFAGLGDRLARVWYQDRATQDWTFYDPDPVFASFNRLTEVSSGQVVTIIITDGEPIPFQSKTLYQGTNSIFPGLGQAPSKQGIHLQATGRPPRQRRRRPPGIPPGRGHTPARKHVGGSPHRDPAGRTQGG